jgi:hypothetical protein
MTDQNHECETVEAALTQVPLKLQSTFLSCQAQFPCLVGSVLDYLVFGLEGFAVFGGCFSLDFFSSLVFFLCWCCFPGIVFFAGVFSDASFCFFCVFLVFLPRWSFFPLLVFSCWKCLNVKLQSDVNHFGRRHGVEEQASYAACLEQRTACLEQREASLLTADCSRSSLA